MRYVVMIVFLSTFFMIFQNRSHESFGTVIGSAFTLCLIFFCIFVLPKLLKREPKDETPTPPKPKPPLPDSTPTDAYDVIFDSESEKLFSINRYYYGNWYYTYDSKLKSYSRFDKICNTNKIEELEERYWGYFTPYKNSRQYSFKEDLKRYLYSDGNWYSRIELPNHKPADYNQISYLTDIIRLTEDYGKDKFPKTNPNFKEPMKIG